MGCMSAHTEYSGWGFRLRPGKRLGNPIKIGGRGVAVAGQARQADSLEQVPGQLDAGLFEIRPRLWGCFVDSTTGRGRGWLGWMD